MENQTTGKRSLEARRKRVQIIKRIIVGLILACIVIPSALSVILFIQLRHVKNELNQIMDTAQVQESQQQTVLAKTKPTKEPEKTPKKVYLTFEDGPSQQTKVILDVLKKKNVKATFFVIGHTDRFSKSIYKRIVKEGHTLGMHSYSHIYTEVYKSENSFKSDLNKLQKYLSKVTGVTPVYYRFPGGSSYQGTTLPMQQCIDILNQKGISYVDWNVSAKDNTGQSISKEELIEHVASCVQSFSTSVVQLHDSSDKAITANSVEALIDRLQSEGYELLPITEETVPIRHVE